MRPGAPVGGGELAHSICSRAPVRLQGGAGLRMAEAGTPARRLATAHVMCVSLSHLLLHMHSYAHVCPCHAHRLNEPPPFSQLLLPRCCSPPPTPLRQTFWRGFFLASMTKVLPLPACVIASSTLFSALHLGPGNLLPIFVLSAACDVLYLRSGTLAAPLLFHAGYNLYEFAGVVLLQKESFV